MGTQVTLPQRGNPTPEFSAHICYGQMARWIKMTLCKKVGLDPSDIVLDGEPASPPKNGAEPPIFGPCLLWPNGCMDQDAISCGGRPLLRPHCARSSSLDGDPPPLPIRREHSPQFSAHVCCGQTAGRIKTPLGTMVGLGPGNIV